MSQGVEEQLGGKEDVLLLAVEGDRDEHLLIYALAEVVEVQHAAKQGVVVVVE